MAQKLEKETILQSVREHYAARAAQSQGCCSDAETAATPGGTFYASDQIADLPDDVAGFSLGCGDAVSLAGLRPGETVLDLGSGGGLECFLAARQVGEAGRVIGVDMTPEMLQRARQARDRLGLSNVEFRQGYIEDLPVEDASVDVIISNCVINLSPDKPAVMREMFRVLKPGGRIAISDIVTHGEMPDELKSDMDLWSECASGALPAHEWENGLRKLGFVEVRVEPNGQQHDWLEKIPAGTPFSASITARKDAGG